MEVQFRAVEGAVSRVYDILFSYAGDCVCKSRGRDIPVFHRSDVIFRHSGQFDAVFKAEERIDFVE